MRQALHPGKEILTRRVIENRLWIYIGIIVALLISCKVSEKNVAGTYVNNWGQKIILYPDRTCEIDIEWIDTVLKVGCQRKTLTGQWSLLNNYLLFTIADSNYAYLQNMSYAFSGKKIRTPKVNMFPHSIIVTYKKADNIK